MNAIKADLSVNILMATYNGELYLDEQISTIYNQDISNLNLIVSDDGSSDKTSLILDRWKAKWNKGKFITLNGPGRGYSENFRSLLSQSDIDADYTAFCDQDDARRGLPVRGQHTKNNARTRKGKAVTIANKKK